MSKETLECLGKQEQMCQWTQLRMGHNVFHLLNCCSSRHLIIDQRRKRTGKEDICMYDRDVVGTQCLVEQCMSIFLF